MNWLCPVVRLMTILKVTIEPSPGNCWKQKQKFAAPQRSTRLHSEVQLKSGRSENMSKEVKTMRLIFMKTALLS